jgi:hypothetical protein
MQDRISQIDEIFLQRTAGPYIGSNSPLRCVDCRSLAQEAVGMQNPRSWAVLPARPVTATANSVAASQLGKDTGGKHR